MAAALLVAGGMFGVYLTYRTVFGRDSGVALLCCSCRSSCSNCTISAMPWCWCCSATFSRSPIFSIRRRCYCGADARLDAGQHRQSGELRRTGRALKANLKTAGVLLAQAGPVMLILFSCFAGAGSAMGLPQDAYSGITGLSDSMSPGAISRLSQSDAIAFRVKFQEDAPPRRQLYWRGRYSGTSMAAPGARAMSGLLQLKYEASGKPYDYEITLEPHNHNWLFALELAAKIPPNAGVTADYILLARAPVRNRVRYDMRSYTDFSGGGADDADELRPGLQLPAGFNPRARRLAQEWAAGGATGRGHRAEGAGLLPRGRLCLHAGAPCSARFGGRIPVRQQARLLRALRLELRVPDARGRRAGPRVTGYQGGDINPVDQYMIVRQSDAHAWAKCGSRAAAGCASIPPPPPRRCGLNPASRGCPATDPLPLMARTTLYWLRGLRYNWDALANKWNSWCWATTRNASANSSPA